MKRLKSWLSKGDNSKTLLGKIILILRNMIWDLRTGLIDFKKKSIYWRERIFLSKIKLDDTVIFYRKHSDDEFIINELLINDEYMFNQLGLKEDSNVIDIGAQIGCFSLRAAKIAKRGNIYSFEPEPKNFNILKRNIKVNQLRNVTVFNKAVYEKEGVIKLFIPGFDTEKRTGQYSIFKMKERHYNKYLKVKTVSLKSILLDKNIKKVDLLKIDCEGAEYRILYSTPDEVFNIIDKIILEYHHYGGIDGNIEDLRKYLEARNYRTLLIKNHPSEPRGIAYFSRLRMECPISNCKI